MSNTSSRSRITSAPTTLRQMVEAGDLFTVPIYQRLYVWGREQVDTLLADLWAAFDEGRSMFYLGGALVMERDSGDGCVQELIDGQQRFTTLWMMSLAWGGALTPFQRDNASAAPRLRVTFGIRRDIDEYFASYMTDQEHDRKAPARIVDALAILEQFLKNDEDRRARADKFKEFVFERVWLVVTRVPSNTDLNRLFEVINSRGQQLQHHEILKARVLASIPAPERRPHAQIWDSCADMECYIESSLKAASGLRLKDLILADDDALRAHPMRSASMVLAELTKLQADQQPHDPMRLTQILEQVPPDPTPPNAAGNGAAKDTTEADEVSSIVSFPVLLQHTLRCWLHDAQEEDLPRISDKELLRLFQDHFFSRGPSANRAMSFIATLWEIRHVFDEHVVKWVAVGDERRLLVCKLGARADGESFRVVREQPTRTDGFGLLQSMLYHSQQITTQYWLTPLLAQMRRYPADVAYYHAYLRHVDNHLHCRKAPDVLSKMSREFLDDTPAKWHRATLGASSLDEATGVGFAHYWFYKLEYLLWDKRPAGLDVSKLDQFRITARNSVEHISPQTPDEFDTNCVSAAILDSFGNLALVSRSINSEFSNRSFRTKRQIFLERNASRLDSLKMALIYLNEAWGDEQAAAHQREMTTLIRSDLEEDFLAGCRR